MSESYIGLSRSSAAVLSGLSVGTWELDLVAGRVRGDVVFARLFGVEAGEAERGITLDRFAAAFHPDDRASIVTRQRAAVETGGLFVHEHRTVPAPGVVRWVLAWGQLERGPDARVIGGRGICLDVTDSRTDGHVTGQVRVRVADAAGLRPLDELAERALELWDLAGDLDAASEAQVRPGLRAVLETVGRLMAEAMFAGPPGPPPEAGSLH